jgi:hypothetical protein
VLTGMVLAALAALFMFIRGDDDGKKPDIVHDPAQGGGV